MDYAALKTLIEGNAYNTLASVGPPPVWKSDVEIAAILSAEDPTISPRSWRTDIPATELVEATAVNATAEGEWAALLDHQRDRFLALLSSGTVDASRARTRAVFAGLFQTAAPTIHAELAALARRDATPAEANGLPRRISHLDVAKARLV